MKENFMKVVGGADFEANRRAEREALAALSSDETFEPRVLVDLWQRIMQNLPEVYKFDFNAELAAQSRKDVRPWSAKKLFDYLYQGSAIWEFVPHTRAVLDEVTYRIEQKDFSPRK